MRALELIKPATFARRLLFFMTTIGKLNTGSRSYEFDMLGVTPRPRRRANTLWSSMSSTENYQDFVTQSALVFLDLTHPSSRSIPWLLCFSGSF